MVSESSTVSGSPGSPSAAAMVGSGASSVAEGGSAASGTRPTQRVAMTVTRPTASSPSISGTEEEAGRSVTASTRHWPTWLPSVSTDARSTDWSGPRSRRPARGNHCTSSEREGSAAGTSEAVSTTVVPEPAATTRARRPSGVAWTSRARSCSSSISATSRPSRSPPVLTGVTVASTQVRVTAER